MYSKITQFPLWKEVAKRIAEQVTEQGYNILFSHEEIREMLNIKKPNRFSTEEEYNNYSFRLWNNIDSLINELLTKYKICLINIPKQGYQVISPQEQILVIPKKQYIKAEKEIRKIIKSLCNVNELLLNDEEKNNRDLQLNKAGFMRLAINRPAKEIEKIKVKKLAK